MNWNDEKDARAFRDGVGAIEALLDVDVPLQIQHAPGRMGRSLCGASGGQVLTMPIGVTCEGCKAKIAARKPRGGRR